MEKRIGKLNVQHKKLSGGGVEMSSKRKLKKSITAGTIKMIREHFAKLTQHVNNLGQLIQLLGASVRRLEVLQGLSEPPDEWNITEARLILIAETEGVSMAQAREKLIMCFGQYKTGGKIRCAGCGLWVSVEEEGVDDLCQECLRQRDTALLVYRCRNCDTPAVEGDLCVRCHEEA